MKLLHLDSSILGQHSASRELGAAIVARWQRDVRGIEVTYRDLAANPLPHLSGGALAQANADEAATAAAVMDEFLSADVIVVGAPMYNFGIPSQLKAWIDRVAVAGKTFRYTADGPQGLAGGKQVIVLRPTAASIRSRAAATSSSPICARSSRSSASTMSNSSAPTDCRSRRSNG